MTLIEFNNQSLYHKLLLLEEKGCFLDKHFTMFGPIKYLHCYALYDFFVETVFDIGNKQFEAVNGFVDGDSLHSYTYFIANTARGILNNGMDDFEDLLERK